MCQSFPITGHGSTKMTQKYTSKCQSHRGETEKGYEMIQSWHTDLVKYEKYYKLIASKQKQKFHFTTSYRTNLVSGTVKRYEMERDQHTDLVKYENLTKLSHRNIKVILWLWSKVCLTLIGGCFVRQMAPASRVL